MGRDARVVTVSNVTSTQIAGVNPRRRRLTISPPLSNDILVNLDSAATATGGYSLPVGGAPLILDPNLFGGDIRQSVQAIALVGIATVYVIDEFDMPDDYP